MSWERMVVGVCVGTNKPGGPVPPLLGRCRTDNLNISDRTTSQSPVSTSPLTLLSTGNEEVRVDTCVVVCSTDSYKDGVI